MRQTWKPPPLSTIEPMKRIHPVKAAGEFSQAAAASWTAGFLQFQGRSSLSLDAG